MRAALGLSLCLCIALAPIATGQDTARGVVYDDANRNSVRDAGEAGLPGVAVSNGREVAQTDGDGAWSLPAGEDTIFFVIKPSGFGVPVNHNKIPQFYYLHKPNGSPPLDPPGVSPTGPLPPSIDFPLLRQEEPAKFDMILFGDTQARGLREVNFVSHDVVEELIGYPAAFGMSLGDIVADDVLLFESINQSLSEIGVPWYNVFGNHDNDRLSKDDRTSDEHYEKVYGPGTYAFEYGNAVFLPLDTVFFKPEGGYTSALIDDQLTFIENYLKLVPKEKLVVLSMHITLMRCEGKDRLFAALKDFPHTLSIAAHAHEQRQFFLTEEQGWQGAEPHHHVIHATVSGSWWCGTFDERGIPHATMNDGAPNGYSIVTFDGNQYSIRFKAASRPDEYQMNIYTAEEYEEEAVATAEVQVNVFSGTERSRVEMSLDDGQTWTAMEQFMGEDPEVLRMHLQNPHLKEEVFGWKMDSPSKTRHMWRAPLRQALGQGTHRVTVRTTDMYGQTYTAHRLFRVVAPGALTPPPAPGA